jgi:hypothetical protein
VVSKGLSTALRFWLRSQVERVEHLELAIIGGDRQILSGCIPQVRVAATGAIYQGLHLSHIQLTASDIRINLGQVLRGKPLRLLHIVPVMAELELQEVDLQASLASPIFAQAIADFVADVLHAAHSEQALIGQERGDRSDFADVTIQAIRLITHGIQITLRHKHQTIVLESGLELANPHRLKFSQLRYWQALEGNASGVVQEMGDRFLELGTDANLHTLWLDDQQLRCIGQLQIVPDSTDSA